MKPLFIALSVMLITGCSVMREPAAYGAIGADTASTALGLSAGAVELNPLGIATLPLSIAAVEYAATLPADQGLPITHGISAVKWGAAASNVVGLAFGPVGYLVGAGVGLILWDRGSIEREYANVCRAWLDEKPGNLCKPFVRS